jgi:hypothetical protein
MTVYLNELSCNDFLTYANERMNKSYALNNRLYPYLNDNRFKLVFEWYCNKNLKCSGSKYNVSANNEHFSSFCSPEIQDKDSMIKTLYHEVFCQTEWACRGLNDFYRGTVEQCFNKQFIKQLQVA